MTYQNYYRGGGLGSMLSNPYQSQMPQYSQVSAAVAPKQVASQPMYETPMYGGGQPMPGDNQLYLRTINGGRTPYRRQQKPRYGVNPPWVGQAYSHPFVEPVLYNASM